MPQFTYYQQLLLDVLSDGMAHSRDELCKALDKYATPDNLQYHIGELRKKMIPVGHNIICETKQRKIYYRHVMMINQGE